MSTFACKMSQRSSHRSSVARGGQASCCTGARTPHSTPREPKRTDKELPKAVTPGLKSYRAIGYPCKSHVYSLLLSYTLPFICPPCSAVRHAAHRTPSPNRRCLAEDVLRPDQHTLLRPRSASARWRRLERKRRSVCHP